MKKIKYIVSALLLAGFVGSCSVAGPIAVTNNTASSKRGVAERKIFLIFSFGHTDLGSITAARNGGLQKVSTIDFRMQSSLFSKTLQTVVVGE